ncbi:hypothetical protein [Actinophytocola sp.]|uniref:hypothetical protein n=1 Tax=Actinophytocola sp. TaxID=1872138 RepID=UPI00389A56C4
MGESLGQGFRTSINGLDVELVLPEIVEVSSSEYAEHFLVAPKVHAALSQVDWDENLETDRVWGTPHYYWGQNDTQLIISGYVHCILLRISMPSDTAARHDQSAQEIHKHIVEGIDPWLRRVRSWTESVLALYLSETGVNRWFGNGLHI